MHLFSIVLFSMSCSSVASFLAWGGGGGKTPKCPHWRKKITYMYPICASERLRSIYICRSQNTCCICIHKWIIAVSFLFLRVWRYKCQYTEKTLTLRKFMYIYERAQKILAVSHSKTAISSNILLILQNFVGTVTYLSAYMYRQKSEKALGGGGGGGKNCPPPPLDTLVMSCKT